MSAINKEQAKEVLKRYFALKWIAEQDAMFDWSVNDITGNLIIKPRSDGDVANNKELFPVVVTSNGQVNLPHFHINHYADDDARANIKKSGQAEATVILCDRFYHFYGHSFLYLHYANPLKQDRIISFNVGPERINNWGHFTKTYISNKASAEEIAQRGVTSFAAFPISGQQAKLLEADCDMCVANPKFRYHLLNWGDNSVNCAAFAMSSLRNIGVPVGALTGHGDRNQKVSNKNLRDFMLARPVAIHRSIVDRAGRAESEVRVPIDELSASTLLTKYSLHLAHFPENGMIMGYCVGNQSKKLGAEKFCAVDVVKLVEHLSSQDVFKSPPKFEGLKPFRTELVHQPKHRQQG